MACRKAICRLRIPFMQSHHGFAPLQSSTHRWGQARTINLLPSVRWADKSSKPDPDTCATVQGITACVFISLSIKQGVGLYLKSI